MRCSTPSARCERTCARDQIESELRKQQHWLREVFDALPIGVNVLDATARTVQVNRALQDMIGYTEQELIGRTFRDYSHPDDAARDGGHP
jgi:PAS domain S-box-containing protein